MRRNAYLIIFLLAFLFSCKKEHVINPPVIPPVVPQKHILLKDIVIPHLPSPFYHFEYNTDSVISKVDFASGYDVYDVFYNNKRIIEMRNNLAFNHDTLRYVYDVDNKLSTIKFINNANVIYRVVFFTYDGDQLRQIEYVRKIADVGYILDRELIFAYYPDGNLKTMFEHQPATTDVADYHSLTTFDNYDNKVNVDDFTIIHQIFHDHLTLPQGFRFQKGNPGKESFSVNGVNLYTVNYTYTFNNNNAPLTKTGDLLYLSGADAGKRFQTNSIYSYY